MRINAVSSTYYSNRPNANPQNFNGIWMRVGQYRQPMDSNQYATAAYYKCTDGKSLSDTVAKDGHNLLALEDCGMTVQECKTAWKALFENANSIEAYQSLEKLKAFIATKVSRNGKHNTMFLEKEDWTDKTKPKKEITYAMVDMKKEELAKKLGLKKPVPEAPLREPDTRHPEEILAEQNMNASA